MVDLTKAHKQIRRMLWGQVRDQVNAQVGDQVNARVGDRVAGQVRAQLRYHPWGQFWGKVWDQVEAAEFYIEQIGHPTYL